MKFIKMWLKLSWNYNNKMYMEMWANWPRGYKTFFMLNSAKHEILIAHK